MATAVFCLTTNPIQASDIVERLKLAGFASVDISVLMPDRRGTADFAIENETKAPEGAAAGASTGAVVGGALGWLTGIGRWRFPAWVR